MLETVYLTILAAAPAITSIVGIIAAFVKIKNNNKNSIAALSAEFNEVKTEVKSAKEYEALKQELILAHQENRELMKLNKELLTKIDRIARD